MKTVAGEQPAAHVDPGLRIGHLHLHVGDVEQAIAFYRDLVGFETQMNLGSAAFVSAGGYHHHLAFNVWRGRGVPAPPPHTIGLRHWTVRLPHSADVAGVRARLTQGGVATTDAEAGFEVDDPWSIRLRVEAVRWHPVRPQGNVVPMRAAERPIDPRLRIGHVHLRTADIDRVRGFLRRHPRLRRRLRGARRARLGHDR